MANAQPFDLQQIDRIIREGHPETLVEVSRELGERLARGGLTTHQLRNLYGEIRRIMMEVEQAEAEASGGSSKLSPRVWWRILLLKPRMAYQASRIQRRDNPMLLLKEVLERAIDQIQEDSKRFHRFVDFVEAIQAYHRYYQEGRQG